MVPGLLQPSCIPRLDIAGSWRIFLCLVFHLFSSKSTNSFEFSTCSSYNWGLSGSWCPGQTVRAALTEGKQSNKWRDGRINE
jgi:hypothetical protein